MTEALADFRATAFAAADGQRPTLDGSDVRGAAADASVANLADRVDVAREARRIDEREAHHGGRGAPLGARLHEHPGGAPRGDPGREDRARSESEPAHGFGDGSAISFSRWRAIGFLGSSRSERS